MSSFKNIAVTSRNLCNKPFLEVIEYLCKNNIVDSIILREKDLSEEEYMSLAKDVITICNKYNTEVILNYFIDVAIELKQKSIQLPMDVFMNNKDKLKDFTKVGVSVHSIEEALKAEDNNANFIVCGHIFKTDCKKGVPPRGVKFLEEICNKININVYAIGGINDENVDIIRNVGASGAIRMSYYMKCI